MSWFIVGTLFGLLLAVCAVEVGIGEDADEATTPQKVARVHLAWLMWCYSEGYVTAEDRGHNWMTDDLVTMHPEDVVTRDRLLAMADEILALLEAER